MTRGRAIKAKCLDCAGGQPKEVTLCQVLDCPLWIYRLGQEPESRTHMERVLKALQKDRDVSEEYRVFYEKRGVCVPLK
jgi:hypothetical protein